MKHLNKIIFVDYLNHVNYAGHLGKNKSHDWCEPSELCELPEPLKYLSHLNYINFKNHLNNKNDMNHVIYTKQCEQFEPHNYMDHKNYMNLVNYMNHVNCENHLSCCRKHINKCKMTFIWLMCICSVRLSCKTNIVLSAQILFKDL